MKTFASILKFHFRENNNDPIYPRTKIVCLTIEIILKGLQALP